MLVQLSGVPGAGKSRLARSIAEASTMVVLNTEVLKSSLIHSGVSVADAGAVTSATTLALAHDLLQQGRDVLVDSPCRYQELLESGQQIAREHGVRYAFIELWVRDWTTVLARLDARSPMCSQIASATAPVPGTVWELGTAEGHSRRGRPSSFAQSVTGFDSRPRVPRIRISTRSGSAARLRGHADEHP